MIDPLDDEKWQKYKDLYSRIATANEKHAGLFISIHHDSVQEQHLLRTEDGKIIDIKDDFKFAKKMQSIRRKPSTYHEEKPGQNFRNRRSLGRLLDFHKTTYRSPL